MAKVEGMGAVPVSPVNLERFSKINQKTPENLAEVKKLSAEFESIFLEIVLKSMRESVQKTDLTDGGNGEQIFQSMLDSEYAKNLASHQSTGLAAIIAESLTQRMSDVPTEELKKAAGIAHYNRAIKEKP